MSDYDTDILLWSERQGELLRRRAAGELVNDTQLDWPNIAEEIDSVGREQLHAVQSLLRQSITHRLKVIAWPQSSAVEGWQDEDLRFRQDAMDRYTPAPDAEETKRQGEGPGGCGRPYWFSDSSFQRTCRSAKLRSWQPETETRN